MSPTATNGINEAMVNGSESEFVKKVMELPAIQDIHKMASENKYGKIGIQMVGSAGNIVSNVAKPFQTQIKQADVFAASSIVYVEQTFPIVKRPTSEIVDGLKKPAMNIATSVQSQINQHAVEPTITMAKKVDASLIGVVDKLESTLNTYLPEEDRTIIERSTNTSTDSADIPQTIRAINIAWTGQRRLTKRVKDQLSSTHSYTNEQLRQLQESSALLKGATDTVHKLNQMLLGVVLNVKDTVNTENIHSRLNDIATVILGDTHKNEDLPTAVQARAVELSQSLLQTTDAIAKHVKEHAKHFPVYLQDRSKPLTEFFEKRYTEIVGEIKNGDGTPIEKARNVIQLTTQHTLPLLIELQDSIHSYSTSLNHSFINTTEKVKSRFVGVAN